MSSELIHGIRSIVSTEIGGSFAALERRLEEVAAKIDAVSVKSGGAKRFDEINERIERVHKSLAARIDRSGGAVDTSQLEGLVTQLAKKIDTAIEVKIVHPAFDELGRKIERLEERLQPAAGELRRHGAIARARPEHRRSFTSSSPGVSRTRRVVATEIDAAAAIDGHLARAARQEDRTPTLERKAPSAEKAAGTEQFRELAERIDHHL